MFSVVTTLLRMSRALTTDSSFVHTESGEREKLGRKAWGERRGRVGERERGI